MLREGAIKASKDSTTRFNNSGYLRSGMNGRGQKEAASGSDTKRQQETNASQYEAKTQRAQK